MTPKNQNKELFYVKDKEVKKKKTQKRKDMEGREIEGVRQRESSG